MKRLSEEGRAEFEERRCLWESEEGVPVSVAIGGRRAGRPFIR